MNYRNFGRIGWKVSELGHGMWGMGAWSGSDDKESLAALHRSVELGINFFDTAWVYGNGRSEKLLRQLIKDYSDQKLYITTKIPPKNFKWPMEPTYSLDQTFPSEHIKEYVQKSLVNLGVQQIDLVLLHGWDDVWAIDDRWQKAVKELKDQSLIQAFGISIDRWEPGNAIEAIKTGCIDAVEVIYNIFDQAPEDALLSICRQQNVAVIARVPFDEGTLTGKLTLDSHWPHGDWRNSYFGPENLKPSIEHAEKLKTILPEEMTLPELALRFILTNSDISTTIPGMRSVENVETNVESVKKGSLNPHLLKQLRSYRWDRKPTPCTLTFTYELIAFFSPGEYAVWHIKNIGITQIHHLLYCCDAS